ncbi:peptidase S8/S53 domain-containing protein [Phaeosphaeria sp. MPI-PUGE-AT-0046c]|nr:peptidase S8/S53 domain-containing protein [Phaeosphaeria sp. MPI-PUGE-AT-0046c]
MSSPSAVRSISGGGAPQSIISGPPKPSQSPNNGDHGQVQFPALFAIDATIEGTTYQLPHPDQPPIEILLLDGSIAQLFAGKIVLRGQTLEVPSNIPSSQPIAVGGQTVTVHPGESKEPKKGDDGDNSSGGGLFAAVGGLIGAAGSASKSVGNAAVGAVNFASGGTGAAAGQLAGAFAGAASGLSGVVSSLNGIQKAFPLGELSQAGMTSFIGAANLGRSSIDTMRSMGKLLGKFDSLKPDVQQKVRDSLGKFSKPDGDMLKAIEALKAFEKFRWEAEVPKTELPSPTAPPDQTKSAENTKTTSMQSSRVIASTSAMSSSTSAASSSATPTSTARPLTYYIATKWGNPVETFKKFIQELDGGAGNADVQEHRQTYKTSLNASHALDLQAKYPFLLYVYTDEGYVGDLDSNNNNEFFHAIPKQNRGEASMSHTNVLHAKRKAPLSVSSRLLPRNLLPEDQGAPYWKKMVSSPFRQSPLQPVSMDPPYLADDSGGKDTTIYIIDTGFDVSQPDLDSSQRTVETYFVSNDVAFTDEYIANMRKFGRANAAPVIAHIGDDSGHGTKMATIAGGKVHGIAPKANLYLLKFMGHWNSEKAAREPDRLGKIQPMALTAVFDTLRLHVTRRLRVNKDAKSVINLSWGVDTDPTGAGPIIEALFPEFLDWCENFKIPIVVAAGNDPEKNLHDKIPQKFGTKDNLIITVGGVRDDGTLWPGTTLHEPGQAGSMSVWSPAMDVVVPGPGNGPNTGTSQAAAIVSGLVAYYYANRELELLFHGDPSVPRPSEDIKKFLTAHAWTRIPQNMLPNDHLGNRLDNLNVVYNLARGDPAHTEFPCAWSPLQVVSLRKRGVEPAAACSRMRSTTISQSVSTSTISSVFDGISLPDCHR